MSLGLYVYPGRDHGQVPHQDRDSDRRAAQLTPKPADPVEVENLIRRAASTAQNEITFRQMVMSEMFERSVSGPSRRKILLAAVDFYRSLRRDPSLGNHNTQVPREAWRERTPGSTVGDSGSTISNSGSTVGASDRKAGGRFVMREPESHPPFETWRTPRSEYGQPAMGERLVRSRELEPETEITPEPEESKDPEEAGLVDTILQGVRTAGRAGMPVAGLVPHVRKHGRQKVSAALRAASVQHRSGRLFLKAEPEALPRGSNVADPRAEPVGSRKIWNKRIVEKKPDGQWHVVGHVAGLEDPKKVQQLDPSVLDRENLVRLLRQLLEIKRTHGDAK